jgi:hypothetical protein
MPAGNFPQPYHILFIGHQSTAILPVGGRLQGALGRRDD